MICFLLRDPRNFFVCSSPRDKGIYCCYIDYVIHFHREYGLYTIRFLVQSLAIKQFTIIPASIKKFAIQNIGAVLKARI
jgi:hypothetical protein